MSERATSETDDLLNTIRELECELAATTKARDHNRVCVKRLTQERDEAREDAKHWCDMHILAVKDFNQARELARELRDLLKSIAYTADTRGSHHHIKNLADAGILKANNLLP